MTDAGSPAHSCDQIVASCRNIRRLETAEQYDVVRGTRPKKPVTHP
jgi:hypothetical protein